MRELMYVEPFALIVKISEFPSRSLAKAIRLPFGENEGKALLTSDGVCVSWRW